ncbi:hypothetical protein MRX96_046690 [Rhipicephalus microplus]
MLRNELKTLASRSCCGHQCSTSTNHGAYEHEATRRSIQEKGLGASDELPLFSQVDNQIHLGNGIFLEEEKMGMAAFAPERQLVL